MSCCRHSNQITVTIRLIAWILFGLSFVLLASLAVAQTCVPDMTFVSDVTVPDDTVFKPDEPFTKTWQVKNTGPCAWEDFSVVHVEGNLLGATSPQPISPTVPIGELASLSIAMAAPAEAGTYTSRWAIRDQSGNQVGDRFYTRIVVGGGEENKTGGPDHSKMIQMNQPFTVNGLTFMVKDLYRNKTVYEWVNTPIIAQGHFAMARFEVTSNTPYTVRLVDQVTIVFTDDPGNVYKANYVPFSVARRAQLAATRHFDSAASVWDLVQPTHVNVPVVHTEDIPDSVQDLYLEFIDPTTQRGYWVYLQPCVSKSQRLYEGRFIDAPER